MQEIGGYIEYEIFNRPMLHENALKLNLARCCLGYLLEARQIHKIALPLFLCDSVKAECLKHNVQVREYRIMPSLLPMDLVLEEGEWIYIVNYYGLVTNECLSELKAKYNRIIVDNVQAYYQLPLENTDTIYTCRKYFGVPDGAILYTDSYLNKELQIDYSFERVRHIIGRFERNASEFYNEYTEEEKKLSEQPILKMSAFTENLLRGIDYENIRNQRSDNYRALHYMLGERNGLNLVVEPEVPFMYPLFIKNGDYIRKSLIQQKIYIPILWPDVLEKCLPDDLEYELASNIVPLPVDQRYTIAQMEYIAELIKSLW